MPSSGVRTGTASKAERLSGFSIKWLRRSRLSRRANRGLTGWLRLLGTKTSRLEKRALSTWRTGRRAKASQRTAQSLNTRYRAWTLVSPR